MQSSYFFRLVLGAALCLAMASPAFSSEATTLVAASKGKKSQAASTVNHSPAAVQSQLDEFAQKTIASINRCVLPSANKKEIKRGPGGGFTARYIEIDPRSVSTSYKASQNTAVQYIGYMNYDEVEYVCNGKTEAAAKSGPCTQTRREKLTELVKYVNGKWTY